MIKNFIISICISCLLVGCVANRNPVKSNNALQPSVLQVMGRAYVDGKDELVLVSSAANFGFEFEGQSCQVFAGLINTGQHNYLQYTVDGMYKQNVRIDGDKDAPITINAGENKKHTVWIYKTTEAHTGPIFIKKITGKNLKALPLPKAPYIEFIGNSITCGAAADGSVTPCGTGSYHDQHNAYFAYGPRVARALNSNFIVSGVSGIGIYRNWNSDGPAMPEVYDKMDFQPATSLLWNFDKATPDVVSIALGTNDFSDGDRKRARLPFDSSAFVDNYIGFVQTVRGKYPRATIALLSSAMVNGAKRNLLQNCLTAVKQKVDAQFTKSTPVELFFFKPMQPHGCGGHPSVDDHAILADELQPFFARLLQR